MNSVLKKILFVIAGAVVLFCIVFGGYLWYLAETSPSIIREGDVKEITP